MSSLHCGRNRINSHAMLATHSGRADNLQYKGYAYDFLLPLEVSASKMWKKRHETAGVCHVQSSALKVDEQHSTTELHRHCTSLSSSCNMREMPVSSSCNKDCSPNALLRMSNYGSKAQVIV